MLWDAVRNNYGIDRNTVVVCMGCKDLKNLVDGLDRMLLSLKEVRKNECLEPRGGKQ